MSMRYHEVYGWLEPGSHMVGKGSEVDWNEGLHSVLRGKLNRLVHRTKGCSRSMEMPVWIVGDGVAERGSDLMRVHSMNTIICFS